MYGEIFLSLSQKFTMNWINLNAYLNHNVGDDLMVEILLSRYPEVMFYFDGSASVSDKFLQYKNFRNKEYYYRKYGRFNRLFNMLTFNKLNNYFFSKLFKKIESRVICSVYIGGSLFQQNKDVDVNKFIESIRNKEICLERNPMFVIGANFGPYYDSRIRDEYEIYFSKCRGVMFRELYSCNLFPNLSNVKYAPDVVFNLGDISIDKVSHGDYKNAVAISVLNVIDRPTINKDAYYNFIVECCDRVIEKGMVPVLTSFCEGEKDREAVDAIYGMLSDSSQKITQCLYYKNNIGEVLSLFKNSKFVFATRFHAMILALYYKKPFFAISYSSKMSNVLEDIGCTNYTEINSVTNCNVNEIFEKNKAYLNIDDYINRASDQFYYLDNFLQEYNI